MALIKCIECGKEISSKADTCPHCGVKNKKRGFGICGILLIGFIGLFLLVFIFFQIQSRDQADNSNTGASEVRLSENSSEYKQLVYNHMKVVMADPEIDGIRIDGSLLYINFAKSQSKSEYMMVAEMNAVKFSNFKKSKLGVSGVTVYCTYNGQEYAQVSARGGQVTSSQ